MGQDQACRFCGLVISKRRYLILGSLWAAREPVADDPEYCPDAPNHAHQPQIP